MSAFGVFDYILVLIFVSLKMRGYKKSYLGLLSDFLSLDKPNLTSAFVSK